MFGLALFLTCISGAFAQCGTFTTSTPPSIIRLPPANGITTSINFVASSVTTYFLTINGGATLATKPVNISNYPSLEITTFGAVSNPAPTSAPTTPGQTSAACQSSSSFFYYMAMVVATLGVVGMRRVEPVFLVLCLGLFAQQASSACTASLNIEGFRITTFEGDVRSRIVVNCPLGGQSQVTWYAPDSTINYTVVYCPWTAVYTKVWAASTNDATCASAAPANVSVDEGLARGSLSFNNMAPVNKSSSTDNLQLVLGQNVPLQYPSVYAGVVAKPGDAPINLLLQYVDIETGDSSGVVPVTIQTGTKLCKFAYKCVEGDCLDSLNQAYDNKCVDVGFQIPNPTSCSDRGNGTGMNCGWNCTSITCLSYCPGGDCSAARACQSGDAGAYPCMACQCPPTCGIANGAWALGPGLSGLALASLLF